jgi:hypothetical protein
MHREPVKRRTDDRRRCQDGAPRVGDSAATLAAQAVQPMENRHQGHEGQRPRNDAVERERHRVSRRAAGHAGKAKGTLAHAAERDDDRIAGRMRLVLANVDVVEREVDRVDVFE